MAKKKVKKSGVLTLRIPPELHAEMAFIAGTLGMDLVGLIRLMVAKTINHYRMEAVMLMEENQVNLAGLDEWKKYNPGRPVREYWDDYWNRRYGHYMQSSMEAFGSIPSESAEKIALRAAEVAAEARKLSRSKEETK